MQEGSSFTKLQGLIIAMQAGGKKMSISLSVDYIREEQGSDVPRNYISIHENKNTNAKQSGRDLYPESCLGNPVLQYHSQIIISFYIVQTGARTETRAVRPCFPT